MECQCCLMNFSENPEYLRPCEVSRYDQTKNDFVKVALSTACECQCCGTVLEKDKKVPCGTRVMTFAELIADIERSVSVEDCRETGISKRDFIKYADRTIEGKVAEKEAREILKKEKQQDSFENN